MKDEPKYKQPDWYDESKLCRISYAPPPDAETGWAIDMGDGTYRVVNDPLGSDACWGDLVRLTSTGLEVIELYDPETDRIE
jgi:hypothetical protein